MSYWRCLEGKAGQMQHIAFKNIDISRTGFEYENLCLSETPNIHIHKHLSWLFFWFLDGLSLHDCMVYITFKYIAITGLTCILVLSLSLGSLCSVVGSLISAADLAIGTLALWALPWFVFGLLFYARVLDIFYCFLTIFLTN